MFVVASVRKACATMSFHEVWSPTIMAGPQPSSLLRFPNAGDSSGGRNRNRPLTARFVLSFPAMAEHADSNKPARWPS